MSVYSRNSLFKLIKNAVSLFTSGKMFRDHLYLAKRLGIGCGGTALLLVLLSLVVRSPAVLALVAGFVGGALQPYLFADVRYE